MGRKLPKNIRKIGKKFWADKMIDGVRYRTGFETVAEAAAYLRDLELRAAEGTLKPRPEKLTIKEWYEDTLRWARLERAESTAENYQYALSNLKDFLEDEGVRYLTQVKPAHVERFKQQRLATSSSRGEGTISPGTVNWELKHISSAMVRAVRLGYLRDNPASASKVTRPRVPESKPKYFSPQEVAVLLESARPHDRPLYALMYYTGLRPGEALHLHWNDILWDRQTILVRAKKGWEPKSRRPREVPLNPELVPYLRELREVGPWVFSHADGRRRRYSGAKANFARLCADLNIDKSGLHTWRHTFATQLVQASGDIRAAQEILGHQDIRHTMKYTHTSPDHLQQVAQKLPSASSGLSKELSKRLRESGAKAAKSLAKRLLEEVGAAGFEPATSTV